MKMRNKGKVHPFTSSSPSPNADSLSVLPATILTLVSFLSLQDREVLTYMITRSLKSTNPSFFPANEDKKKTSKKQCGHNSPALFDCDCFHCYTSFWFRWDSSPNRELIHQAIEAFEDHLNNGETFKNGKTKLRDRLGRRRSDKLGGDAYSAAGILDSAPAESSENQEHAISAAATEGEEEEARDREGKRRRRRRPLLADGCERRRWQRSWVMAADLDSRSGFESDGGAVVAMERHENHADVDGGDGCAALFSSSPSSNTDSQSPPPLPTLFFNFFLPQNDVVLASKNDAVFSCRKTCTRRIFRLPCQYFFSMTLAYAKSDVFKSSDILAQILFVVCKTKKY